MRLASGGLWLALACALLHCAACAGAAKKLLAPGVCQTVDIRNFPQEFQKLKGCRVVEGHLSVVLMERATFQDFENVSFPELREVTGYVMIYRMKGVRNLGDMFPNLSVVRGMQLFKDYSLIIFDSPDMEMLGLRSLSTIEQGAVRIQNNDRLCYVNTIDWNRIIRNGMAVNNIIRSNYDTRLCGMCPMKQNGRESYCPTDLAGGSPVCWDDRNCQKVCPATCEGRPCMDNGMCCNEACLGGCDGPSVHECHVCRHFSLGYGPNLTCTQTCPSGMYELYRRCVTESECRAMPPPAPPLGRADPNPARIYAYKLYNNTKCVWACPSGYMETGTKEAATCTVCSAGGCVRECPGGKIDSLGDADQFRGCTRVTGALEITLRASGGNTIAALEAALGDVREISGRLIVKRSDPLISLMFLKNLQVITPDPNDDKALSLEIFSNPNLELLWDWEHHKQMHIRGSVRIHYNRKLCFANILPLQKIMNKNFTQEEVSEENNGDQASCYQEKLNLTVSQIHRKFVVLAWDKLCFDDPRKLLGYSIYYIIAEDKNVTIYEQRDACSDVWNVLDLTAEDVMKRGNATGDADDSDHCPKGTNKAKQPHFQLLTQLIPYTRYAIYVKTYTTLRDKKGAQSPIIYFRTLPGRPSLPSPVTAAPRGPHGALVSWRAPAAPNGTLTTYLVEVQANAYNRDTITAIVARDTNYCSNPNLLPNLMRGRGELETETVPERENKSTGDVTNGSCVCPNEARPNAGGGMWGQGGGTRFTSIAEAERWESIQFENELQNQVYVKSGKKFSNKSKYSPLVRSRRSVENSLSALVDLSGHTKPELGRRNFTNATDEKGYMKSMFFELDGKTRKLVLENLRHFTWYTVNVWACRARQANESDNDYAETWCSERAYYTFRTKEMPNADVVEHVEAEIISNNKSLSEVNITWRAPKDPNGFVVAYNVHYLRGEDSQSQDLSLQKCIPSWQCLGGACSLTLRKVLAGNYSVRVTPVTLAGPARGQVGGAGETHFFIMRGDSGYSWVWYVVVGCALLAAILAAALWYARRGLLAPAEASKLFASVNPEYVATVYVPDEWEVPRSSVEFIRELGQGSFGMVYEGIAKNIEKGKPETRCAVKTVNEHATDRERIEFLNEASVMKAFDTAHVVRLLGVVSRGQPTLVVMELMESGDLKTYLRSHRPDADSSLPKKGPQHPPTLQNILQMAVEIADGMAYLSAKKFVHRDLAARNCMVAGDLTVKVGDFGMTRDIYETDYYRKGTKGLLPVRWMSPESLKDGVFSSNSDVWSYGVVLWEMATLAMQPYQGLSNEQVLRYVVEGGVMERPEHCPDQLYELMRACWAHRPAARPSFLQLVADLAPQANSSFRQKSFFHSQLGQELYGLQRAPVRDEECEVPSVNVGAVATGSGSNLFGVSGRLASWVRGSRGPRVDDAAAELLAPGAPAAPTNAAPKANGAPLTGAASTTGC